MQNRIMLLLSAVFVAGCATTPARQAADLPSLTAQTVPAACPASADVPELLARHSRAFGSKEAVARALPRSFTGEIVSQGKRGSVEIALAGQGRFSQTTVLGGMQSAGGVDAKGPWSLGYAGVPLRLRSDEAVEFALGAWLQGRDYLNSFDPQRDSTSCSVVADRPQISVRYNLPQVGNPMLTFDFSDASLLSANHLDSYGHTAVLGFGTWSDADQTGVRWPLTIHQKEASGNESIVTLTNSVPGIVCPSRASEDCLAPPRSKIIFSWPHETPVRVPATFFLNEVLLHAEVGGRTFWGLMDSGATINVIDSGSPLARAFHAAAGKASGPEPLAFGEIREAVKLGDLLMEHLPAAALPMPSFDVLGARRPEMLIGYPIFLGTAVRIDYARQEVLLAKDARSLHAENAIAVPLKVVGRTVVAEGRIDGIKGLFVLDSGYSGPLDLFRDWAASHGFPGSRPAYTFRQQGEFGDGQTDEKRMRPATFELGPIRLTEPLVAIESVRSPSDRIAGQLGYGVFASCAAVVFDIENRNLWLEPPCDRDVPEDLFGWALERKDSAAYPDSPWVVRFVVPGGSADLAGVKAGDRLLQLGSKPAILDISTFESITKQPPGAKVLTVIMRGKERKEMTVNLVRVLNGL